MVAGGIPGSEIGARASSRAGAHGRWRARAACGGDGWRVRHAGRKTHGGRGHGDAVDALAPALRISRDKARTPATNLQIF